MKGRLLIDGIDAFSGYGVFVEQYGYAGLVQFPPFKKIEFTSWPEEDGIEADLSNPVLDINTVSVNFAILNYDLVGILFQRISDGAYHEFNFVEISKVVRLRLISHPSNSGFGHLGKFTLQFADDNHFEGYEYLAPIPMGIAQRGYKIDDVELSAYGVVVLDGSDDSLLKSPSVKKNLLINIEGSHGGVYDGEIVYFESKDVTLKCLLRADNVATFWRNYNALFYNLTRPEERIFYWRYTDEEYPCYYKSSSVDKFDVLGSRVVWCEFSITLVFTSFRLREIEMILVSEGGEYIITEDECLIDLTIVVE